MRCVHVVCMPSNKHLISHKHSESLFMSQNDVFKILFVFV